MQGTIFDIKSFAIHDGSGIRTTVFLKGCPLRCRWCHNPEGLSPRPQKWWFANKCIGCRLCVAACKNGALHHTQEDGTSIDRELCKGCGMCVSACPTEALCYDGYQTDSDAVIAKVLEDRVFYRNSGGGVTLSGGEPTMQSAFALEILRGLHRGGIQTGIETCMYCPQDVWREFVDTVDEFMVDIKCFDADLHKKYTGVNNDGIMDNFCYLATHRDRVLVRIPLIPGMTAKEENLRDIARFVHGVNPELRIELMNYNPLAVGKYRLMKKDYCLDDEVRPYSTDELDKFCCIIEKEGVKTIRN